MSEFIFKTATRQGIKPLIGLYGTSNSGKTLSALLLARGFAGPNGKLILGDTESGRGALYADMIPGGYIHCDIEPPFSPKKFMDFLDAAEAQGVDALVIDSFSHEWEGEGGVLDWAAENEASGKKGQLIWKEPKMNHAKLVMRLMRSKTFVVVCLRAKFKSRQAKDDKGRSTIVKDDHVTPMQGEDFLFDMTAHAEMQPLKPGSIRLTKWSVQDLANCFPQDGGDLLSVSHGEAIAQWANNPGGRAEKSDADKRTEIQQALKKVGCSTWGEANTWLIKQGILEPEGEKAQSLTGERLDIVLRETKEATR